MQCTHLGGNYKRFYYKLWGKRKQNYILCTPALAAGIVVFYQEYFKQTKIKIKCLQQQIRIIELNRKCFGKRNLILLFLLFIYGNFDISYISRFVFKSRHKTKSSTNQRRSSLWNFRKIPGYFLRLCELVFGTQILLFLPTKYF